MRIQAAVAREINRLEVEGVELDPPGSHEVLVRMRAAGVCRSDLSTYQGKLRATPPIVLGHEGAGIVEQVGESVQRIRPGDRVLVNWLPGCNACPTCLGGRPNLCERFPQTTYQGWLPDGTSRLQTLDGIRLKHYLSSATMAEFAVLDEAGVVVIPPDVPFDVASVIGCAVITGIGAVVNTAQVRAGSSAAVIGAGGVGLSAIMGCQLAGCHPIIAVDVVESKLDMARDLGATHVVNARTADVVAALQALARLGPDTVFDSVGAGETITQALLAAKPGGTAVIIGLDAVREQVPISPAALVQGNRRLLGSFAGSARPQVDLPRLVELYRAGRLPLDRLVSRHYNLSQVSEAFQDLEAGLVARGVITFAD